MHVSIIEDDPVTLNGLVDIVERATDLRLGTATNSVEKFERDGCQERGLVVLDLRLRGGGLEGEEAVKKLVLLGSRILVVSMFDEEVPVLSAIRAGAHGYLTKEAEPDEILRAIRTVGANGTYFSPAVAGLLLRDGRSLTEREIEVLRMVASGDTTNEISRQLKITERTVNGHLDNIRNKTGYRRRADLTRLAYEKGIITRLRGRR